MKWLSHTKCNGKGDFDAPLTYVSMPVGSGLSFRAVLDRFRGLTETALGNRPRAITFLRGNLRWTSKKTYYRRMS